MSQSVSSFIPNQKRPFIGVVHLPPLPGSPGWMAGGRPSLRAIVEDALRRADGFLAAGADALIVENYGDGPCFAAQVPSETVASMAVVAGALRREFHGALGINVLRNDGRAALGIAQAIGGQSFIRVNVLSGVAATDQGLIEGAAAELLRLRESLRSASGEAPKIMADVHVKHARPLGEQDIGVAAADLVERACADAVVVSGSRTGSAPQAAALVAVRASLGGRVPVFIGSGLSLETMSTMAPLCEGAIVASAALTDGKAGNPVDLERAATLISAWRATASAAPDVNLGDTGC